MHDPKNLTKPN